MDATRLDLYRAAALNALIQKYIPDESIGDPRLEPKLKAITDLAKKIGDSMVGRKKPLTVDDLILTELYRR